MHKGYYSLRVAWRTEIMKSAKLRPRMSDENWAADAMVAEEEGAAGIGGLDGSESVTEESLRGFFSSETASGIISSMGEFFKCNRHDMTVACHMYPSRASNDTLMKIMGDVQSLSAEKDVALLVGRVAAEEVEKLVPVGWHDAVMAIRSVKERGIDFKSVNANPVVDEFQELISLSLVSAMRAQMFLYVLKAVGAMKCRMNCGASTMRSYLPMHCVRAITGQLEAFDVAKHGKDHFETNKIMFLEPLMKGTSKDGRSGTLEWVDAAKHWVGEFYDLSEFIVEHKGETFRQERDVFFSKHK